MPTYVLGLDVGGTKIQAGLVDRRHRVTRDAQLALDRRSRTAALASIRRAVAAFVSPAVKSIGIGITGLVDQARGVVVASPNLPKDWRNVNLKRHLERAFRRPVTVDNDAHCIGLAEATVGAGKRYQIVLTITIGTGIGTGLVLNRRIYRGALGAIEFGHTTVSGGAMRCSCGQTGHLESIVSGPGISSQYRRLSGRTVSSSEVVRRYRRGDSAARQALGAVAQTLAVGLANAIHCYNPEIIVLNGGLSQVPEITTPAIRNLKQLLLYETLAKTKVLVSKLGYRAGVIGAALLTER